jgi:hypothetical protein
MQQFELIGCSCSLNYMLDTPPSAFSKNNPSALPTVNGLIQCYDISTKQGLYRVNLPVGMVQKHQHQC